MVYSNDYLLNDSDLKIGNSSNEYTEFLTEYMLFEMIKGLMKNRNESWFDVQQFSQYIIAN